MNNQVGGVGVVHMHADPQELPLTEGPMDKTGPVGDRSHDKK
jgi:hypothetical protein